MTQTQQSQEKDTATQNPLSESPHQVESLSSLITTAEAFVKHHFANHDPSHDWHHVHRVRLFALHLSRDPSLPSPPDMVILELAALFHDMCDRKYLPSGPSASVGANAPNAHNVLAPFFDDGAITHSELVTLHQRATIERIVDNVSWSKDEARRRVRQRQDQGQGQGNSPPPDDLTQWQRSTPEFQCVSDSDRLDAIGSIGILRAAAYSAVKGGPLHIPPNNPANDSVPPAEQAQGYNGSTIAHFHDKLLRIQGDRLWTDWAREEAERRQGMVCTTRNTQCVTDWSSC